jgi:hypothetical protein
MVWLSAENLIVENIVGNIVQKNVQKRKLSAADAVQAKTTKQS